VLPIGDFWTGFKVIWGIGVPTLGANISNGERWVVWAVAVNAPSGFAITVVGSAWLLPFGSTV
jgi:hypothetical protein